MAARSTPEFDVTIHVAFAAAVHTAFDAASQAVNAESQAAECQLVVLHTCPAADQAAFASASNAAPSDIALQVTSQLASQPVLIAAAQAASQPASQPASFAAPQAAAADRSVPSNHHSAHRVKSADVKYRVLQSYSAH